MTFSEAAERMMEQMRQHMPKAPDFGLGARHRAETPALTQTLDFGADPGELRMLSLLPPDLPSGAPLVVLLHGCGQSASEIAHGSGWADLAQRHGFALLLPEQRRANNAHGCFNWFQPGDVTRGEGEVASIAAMVAHMVATHGLDPARVFVTGLSAGGAMTAALLATYPEVFAGGAIIAGLPYGSAATVKEALGTMTHAHHRDPADWAAMVRRAAPLHVGPYPSVAIWQGEADPVVDPENAEQLRKQWAAVHGVDGVPGAVEGRGATSHRAWRNREGHPVLQMVKIAGLGHAIPISAEDAREPGLPAGANRHVQPIGISAAHESACSWGLIGR